MGKPIPLDDLRRLYLDEKLSVAEIVKRLGLTRQAVYERFRNNGIPLRTAAENPPKTGLTKEALVDLYHGQKLTTPQIAARLGCSKHDVIRDMDKYEIARSYRRGSKYRYIESLMVGDQITITNESGKHPTSVLKHADRIGIRIVIRRLDSRNFLVTRTPLLNSESILQMRNEGMKITNIAEVFLTSRATIARFVSHD